MVEQEVMKVVQRAEMAEQEVVKAVKQAEMAEQRITKAVQQAETAENEAMAVRNEAMGSLERAKKAEGKLELVVGRAEDSEKQISVLAERALVAEKAVDMLQRHLDAKEMLVDSIIEDQQVLRQTSLDNLNINVLMKDEEFSGGWCDADDGAHILAAMKDTRSSGITPSYLDKIRIVRILINIIWSLLTYLRMNKATLTMISMMGKLRQPLRPTLSRDFVFQLY